jgi:hypothetical protein
MIKHSRKHSCRKSDKNIKSHQTGENVTNCVVAEEDVETIRMFSYLDISDKSSQSSSCDQRIVDQLLKKRKSLKSGPSGSSPDSHIHSLSDSQSPGNTQNKNIEQTGKNEEYFSDTIFIRALWSWISNIFGYIFSGIGPKHKSASRRGSGFDAVEKTREATIQQVGKL